MISNVLKNVVRFRGTVQEWDANIASGMWEDMIVFGMVRDASVPGRKYKYVKRFYGGRSITNVDFEYVEGVYWENDIDPNVIADSSI